MLRFFSLFVVYTFLLPWQCFCSVAVVIDSIGISQDEQTKACELALAGRSGTLDAALAWVHELCGLRFIFVGGFMHTGTGLVRYLISTHPSVRAHSHTGRVEDEGQYLQKVFPIRSDREKKSATLCGCEVCGYYCPRMQDRVVTAANREKLYREWFGSRHFAAAAAAAGHAVWALEKTPDFLALMRNRFFPHVSAHAFPIRHPFCDQRILAYSPRHHRRTTVGLVDTLEYWLRAWHDLLVRQLPQTTGPFAVVRFESVVTDEASYARELWRVLGLPAVATHEQPSHTGTGRRKLPFHAKDLGKDEGKVLSNVVWGQKDCSQLRACARDRRCSALWEAAGGVMRFFGYANGKKGVATVRQLNGPNGTDHFALWNRQALAPLQHMHWPV